MRGLARGIAREIPRCWSRLLAVQQVVDEVVEEFQDEVAIPEVLRDNLLLLARSSSGSTARRRSSSASSCGPKQTRRPSTCSTAGSQRSADDREVWQSLLRTKRRPDAAPLAPTSTSLRLGAARSAYVDRIVRVVEAAGARLPEVHFVVQVV